MNMHYVQYIVVMKLSDEFVPGVKANSTVGKMAPPLRHIPHRDAWSKQEV